MRKPCSCFGAHGRPSHSCRSVVIGGMSHGVLCMALFFIIVNAARKHSTIEIEITFEHKLKRTAAWAWALGPDPTNPTQTRLRLHQLAARSRRRRPTRRAMPKATRAAAAPGRCSGAAAPSSPLTISSLVSWWVPSSSISVQRSYPSCRRSLHRVRLHVPRSLRAFLWSEVTRRKVNGFASSFDRPTVCQRKAAYRDEKV